jgi:YVTN family beta-propeller protein
MNVRWLVVLALLAGGAQAQNRLVNWESPHVHPLELTPDGTRLLAVNTADARLEIFDVGVAGGVPVLLASVPVGVEPVSVRARGNGEAWVVNHLSDSVSVVDLASARVVRTLDTGDEPADVIFAGTPPRAFVSVSQRNQVRVYNPADLAQAPVIVPIQGEEPRALATSPDGTRVYVGLFESGNASTIVELTDVSNPGGPYGGQNPPPNDGNAFDPPIAGGLPPPPRVAQIVRRDAGGAWRDGNGRDWSAFVTWNLHDHDVAVIETGSLATTYVNSLMTTVMALGVRADGRVAAVGTEATNEVRFEPNLTGTFVRVRIASFDPAAPAASTIADLNPHLDYSVSSVPPATRELALGDPRAIVWRADGARAYVAGMGSNNVIATDANGTRLARVDVGQGPSGLALSGDGARLYVLNRFDGSISTLATASFSESARTPFFDPTPDAIALGRPLLYDTHATSGLGQVACASCHIDARSDFLAWDLGNPAGAVKPFNQTCRPNQTCDDWHPMKGPIVTQVLQGIVGNGAMHWRGDRENLAAFAPAFVGLQGRDSEPTVEEMQRFEAFIDSIDYGPNPNRNRDGSLPATLAVTGGTGNPANGQQIFLNQPTLGPSPCVDCHTLPTGTSNEIDNPMLPLAPQPMKTAQLRGLWEKTGWSTVSLESNKGFGFNSDSEFDTLNALLLAGFNFGLPAQAPQRRRDVEAFMLAFDTETHASVGQQITFDGSNNDDATLTARLAGFVTLADAGTIGLIAKARSAGSARGYVYATQNVLLSDRENVPTTLDALRAAAAPGAEVTITVVPSFTQYRMGADRDADGAFDRDELDFGADPADAGSLPVGFCRPDFDANGTLEQADLDAFSAAHAAGNPRGNYDRSLGGDGRPSVTAADLAAYQADFAAGCEAEGEALFANGFE